MRVSDCLEYLDKLTPFATAFDWDNVGLLIGRREQELTRFLSCLTVTEEVVQEAIAKECELILSHHPFPFRPLATVNDASMAGSLALLLISQGVSVISPHTAFDNAAFGINQMIAEHLGLFKIRPIYIDPKNKTEVGRFGAFAEPTSLREICQQLSVLTTQKYFQVNCQDFNATVITCAMTCGSAGDLMPYVLKTGSEVWIIGELSYHRALEASAAGLQVIAAGHHATESFAVHRLGENLARQFPSIKHFKSDREKDPWKCLSLM